MPNLSPFTALAKPALKDPVSFMLPLHEPVKVERAQGGSLLLRWQETADRIVIYSGTNPDDMQQMTRTLAVCGVKEAVIGGLDLAVRHYFRLAFQGGPWDGRSFLAAERRLPSQKGVNWRDAGGYHTTDGQMVRWGKLYRSGSLFRLTHADQATLRQIGPHLVCDLRSSAERTKRPSKLPDSPNLVDHPLPMESSHRWERLRGAFYVFFRKGRIDDYLLDGYRRVLLENNAYVIGELFQRLADPNQLPALIHCTAGKDRTGLVCAMLLLTLGVPQETVLADYTMSNLFYNHFRDDLEEDLKQIAPWGVPMDHLQDLLLVKEKTLLGALGYLNQKYGSLDNYLRGPAGISEDVLHALRANWLLPVD